MKRTVFLSANVKSLYVFSNLATQTKRAMEFQKQNNNEAKIQPKSEQTPRGKFEKLSSQNKTITKHNKKLTKSLDIVTRERNALKNIMEQRIQKLTDSILTSLKNSELDNATNDFSLLKKIVDSSVNALRYVLRLILGVFLWLVLCLLRLPEKQMTQQSSNVEREP